MKRCKTKTGNNWSLDQRVGFMRWLSGEANGKRINVVCQFMAAS